MRLFRLMPEILNYQEPADFVAELSPCESDFVFISKSTYTQYFSGLFGDATVAFKSDYAKGEPTDSDLNHLIHDFMQKPYKRIIAIGGGSVIDMAKSLTVTDGSDAVKLFQKETEIVKRRELIAVPTTCGAGSEVTNISILSIAAMESKFGLVVDEIFPDKAVLIGKLIQNLPDHFFITSAIDGLIHSIESYLSAKSNVYTELYSEKAILDYIRGFRRIASEGIGVKAAISNDFLIASNMAGIAFSNTGTGAVHAISYPLSGKYHVTHGEANALFLSAVLHLYEEKDNGTKLTLLKNILAQALDCDADASLSALKDLLEKIIALPALHTYGMQESEISLFANSVVENQQRLLSNSYIHVETEDIEKIYQQLF